MVTLKGSGRWVRREREKEEEFKIKSFTSSFTNSRMKQCFWVAIIKVGIQFNYPQLSTFSNTEV